MKYFKLILVSLAVFAFSPANSQKSYLTGNDIPKQISAYIQKYFPEIKINRVKKEVKPLKTEYEVYLLSGAELEFDGNFNVKEIKSRSGIPQNVLPVNIQNYLSANYPNANVKEWSVKKNGHKVELKKGPDLYFDPNGKFISKKIDD